MRARENEGQYVIFEAPDELTPRDGILINGILSPITQLLLSPITPGE
jgi:hypothetical protein